MIEKHMNTQVKSTLDELRLLIIHHDVELARQLSYIAELEVTCSVSTTTPDDALVSLRQLRPQVVIVHDDGSTNPAIFEVLRSAVLETEPLILIAVNDHPTSKLFALADQVIPHDYLPFIEQIVLSHIIRLRSTIDLENRFSKMESENRHLTQQLAFANQTRAEINILKQAVIHSVSHELRTPMLQVKSAVALLSEDESTNRNIVDLATEATTRLEGGIRNVTLLNELMSESSSIESFTTVPIIQVIQAALRNLGRSWEHKKDIERVTIVPNIQTQHVLCDKQRLIIAIQLLLDNALKFSQEMVNIDVTHSDNRVTVSIQDRGIGIPREQLKRIFEPFYQIDGSSTRRFGGMGIGLAIVQLIMEQHCTVIQVDSTQGKGSTFAFDLQSVSD
jgi:signal transduction histidine kinase